MIRVRATKDGHYGGYYRNGPQNVGTPGYIPGEVFDVDETPYALKDHDGRPVYERDLDGTVLFEMENGKPKMDKAGKKIPKVQMGNLFTEEWMERVSDDEPITNDYPPAQLPRQMLAPKIPNSGARTSVAQKPRVVENVI